jgi:hypothetical protein
LNPILQDYTSTSVELVRGHTTPEDGESSLTEKSNIAGRIAVLSNGPVAYPNIDIHAA